jgi:hypothetical protein
MNADEILKALLPLTFIAIWAIASLFSRENRPAPRPAQPLGPRPGGFPPPPGQRPGPRPGQVTLGADQAARFGNPGGANPRGGMGDEILIIRPEAQRTPVRPTSSGAAARRPSKARAAAAPAPKRAEPAPNRGLSGLSGHGVSQQLASQPLEAIRLLGVQSGLSQPSSTGPATASPRPPSDSPVDPLNLFNSRDKVRAAILMSEILQPPVSMRRRRPF